MVIQTIHIFVKDDSPSFILMSVCPPHKFLENEFNISISAVTSAQGGEVYTSQPRNMNTNMPFGTVLRVDR